MPSFSLVLATVDRSTALQTVIGSLLSQTDRDFELIVVDQNDDDRVLPFIEPVRQAGVAVVHLRSQRQGLAHARNVGLASATGRIVAFPDDDCWYEPDVLSHARERLARDAELAGVVGRWIELENHLGVVREPAPLELEAFRRFRGTTASSICLFLRRDAVDRVGRFDSRLGVGRWYGASEETDLVLRLLSAGLKLEYDPSIRLHHAFPPATFTSWSIAGCQSIRRRNRGIGALYAKHRLPGWVVARGLLGPIARAFAAGNPLASVSRSLFEVLGRLEGMLRWKLEER